VEGVDPEGAYRVQVDDEPARWHAPRVVKTIQAQLSNSKGLTEAEVASRRARVPGTTTFLDLVVQGHPDDFVERTVRIRPLSPAQTAKARATMLLATPAKTGRVTPFIESVPAED
jgi:hypothetical protein